MYEYNNNSHHHSNSTSIMTTAGNGSSSQNNVVISSRPSSSTGKVTCSSGVCSSKKMKKKAQRDDITNSTCTVINMGTTSSNNSSNISCNSDHNNLFNTYQIQQQKQGKQGKQGSVYSSYFSSHNSGTVPGITAAAASASTISFDYNTNTCSANMKSPACASTRTWPCNQQRRNSLFFHENHDSTNSNIRPAHFYPTAADGRTRPPSIGVTNESDLFNSDSILNSTKCSQTASMPSITSTKAAAAHERRRSLDLLGEAASNVDLQEQWERRKSLDTNTSSSAQSQSCTNTHTNTSTGGIIDSPTLRLELEQIKKYQSNTTTLQHHLAGHHNITERRNSLELALQTLDNRFGVENSVERHGLDLLNGLNNNNNYHHHHHQQQQQIRRSSSGDTLFNNNSNHTLLALENIYFGAGNSSGADNNGSNNNYYSNSSTSSSTNGQTTIDLDSQINNYLTSQSQKNRRDSLEVVLREYQRRRQSLELLKDAERLGLNSFDVTLPIEPHLLESLFDDDNNFNSLSSASASASTSNMSNTINNNLNQKILETFIRRNSLLQNYNYYVDSNNHLPTLEHQQQHRYINPSIISNDDNNNNRTSHHHHRHPINTDFILQNNNLLFNNHNHNNNNMSNSISNKIKNNTNNFNNINDNNSNNNDYTDINSITSEYFQNVITPYLSIIDSLQQYMEKSLESQTNIQQWDKKMGLKRSHSSTMTKTNRSRKQLLELFHREKKQLKRKFGSIAGAGGGGGGL